MRERYYFTLARSWRLFKASPLSGFCQQRRKICKMASGGEYKDFGPLVGAIDQGTSSSRFLVSGNSCFNQKTSMFFLRSFSMLLKCPRDCMTVPALGRVSLAFDAIDTIFSFDLIQFYSFYCHLSSRRLQTKCLFLIPRTI